MRPSAVTFFFALLSLTGVVLAGCAASVPRPRLDSGEYIRSAGLAAINASASYRRGVTGRGVTVALIDCGLNTPQAELQHNVSPRSIDLLEGQRTLPSQERHATLVASPLGSALDGQGLVGVAYNATILSIRADFDGGLNGQCAFKSADLADALDYATVNGARIVILPLQGRRPLGARFESALQRTVDAGVAVVISAGNDAAAEPSFPARYAIDPRYAGAIVAVGALSASGELAQWSNRAGPAQAYFLAAPGERVITDCDKKWCRQISGTSVAAPYVGGALALVMEGRPDLDGRGAIGVLLKGAQPVVGADAIYGRGLVDVGQAFKQMGRATSGSARPSPTLPAQRL